VDVVRQADLDWPLVIAGDGPDRQELERAAKASGRAIEFKGWLDRAEATRLLANASMLIFPSRGPESLSRVLLEASALGVPIAAMDTGGTRDIVEDEITGLLSSSPEELAADVRRLRQDAALRARLGEAAKRKAEREFDAAAVVARIEALYMELGRPAK
jgi:glycosyltransferase involved in cell wall biosynthesis